MPISDLRDAFRGRLLEFAWSQWAQLGVSAHLTRSDRWVLDPEALIVFSVELARRDPRLFDELLDWISLNGRLLSLQRIRNLVTRFPVEQGLVDAVVAWVADAAPAVRWPKAGRPAYEPKSNVEPLFTSDVVSFVGEQDPVFARYGYMRPRVRRSGKSVEPDARLPVNLALRLRLFFGPGTRSEIVRVLLTSTEGPLDAARIADEAGFAKRNVNETLNALVASGAAKARRSGNERRFVVVRDRWATFLEIGSAATDIPVFVSWVHFFPPLLKMLLWLEREAVSDDSDYLISSRARDLVAQISQDLETVGMEIPRDRSRPGAAYLAAFEELVASLPEAIADGV